MHPHTHFYQIAVREGETSSDIARQAVPDQCKHHRKFVHQVQHVRQTQADVLEKQFLIGSEVMNPKRSRLTSVLKWKGIRHFLTAQNKDFIILILRYC